MLAGLLRGIGRGTAVGAWPSGKGRGEHKRRVRRGKQGSAVITNPSLGARFSSSRLPIVIVPCVSSRVSRLVLIEPKIRNSSSIISFTISSAVLAVTHRLAGANELKAGQQEKKDLCPPVRSLRRERLPSLDLEFYRIASHISIIHSFHRSTSLHRDQSYPLAFSHGYTHLVTSPAITRCHPSPPSR